MAEIGEEFSVGWTTAQVTLPCLCVASAMAAALNSRFRPSRLARWAVGSPLGPMIERTGLFIAGPVADVPDRASPKPPLIGPWRDRRRSTPKGCLRERLGPSAALCLGP